MASTYFNAPVGGTSGLPQYLQQKQSQQQPAPGGQQQMAQTLQSGGTQVAGQTAAPGTAKKEPVQKTFGAGAAPAGAGPAQQKPAVNPAPQPVGPISSTGNPTIPAAPPAAPPPAAVPGGTPVTEQAPAAGQPGGFDFGTYLQHQLQGQGGQGRYGSDLITSLRQSMNDELTAQQNKQQDALIADANARGVYHGSPLTTSEGDLAANFQRLRQQGDNALLTQIADANAQDQQNAVGNMFQFGNGQLNQQQLQAYILSQLAAAGQYGGPTIPGTSDAYGSLPAPGQPDYSSIYQQLGTLFGPKPPAAGATK